MYQNIKIIYPLNVKNKKIYYAIFNKNISKKGILLLFSMMKKVINFEKIV